MKRQEKWCFWKTGQNLEIFVGKRDKIYKKLLENGTKFVILLVMIFHMLYRKVAKQVNEWIDNGDDALLITGARQVGKTYLIRQLLKDKKRDYVEFNFEKQPHLLPLFKSAIEKDEKTFIENLRVAANKVIKDNTVIFFDEIQECKEIVTIIKFLVEHGKYKYVLSGSLLGVELRDLRSAPVGYMTTIDMYPMDLEEFFLANGLGQDVIEILRNCFERKLPVSDFIHENLIDAFYKYLIIGGMPEAVKTFIETGDYNKVKKVHNKIYREYKRDFSKYESDKKLKLINTYDLIPAELDQKNKRYIFTDLYSEFRFDRYENSFMWLNDAGVALPTYNVTEVEVPLEASKKSNLFKLFLSDVGMLTSMYGTATIMKLLSKEKEINCGAMFENFAAQELKAHGFNNLYYFNNKKHGEVDFLIEYEGDVLPIEIKSGKDYQSHSAMSYFCENKFSRGFVFSDYNFSVVNNIYYYPIYMLMFVQNDKEIEQKGKLDLSKLSK